MKKVLFFGFLTVALLLLFSGCFQPLSPREYSVTGEVLTTSGERVPFATIEIDGKTILETDETGRFQVSLKRGDHSFLAKEPGAKSITKRLDLSKEENLSLVMDQFDATEGWKYRQVSGGFRATLLFLAASLPDVVSLQLSGDFSRDDVSAGNARDFVFVMESSGKTQIDWTPILRQESTFSFLVEAFSITFPLPQKITELARISSSDGETARLGDYRSFSTPPSAGRSVVDPSELRYVGDMVTDAAPDVYAPDGKINVYDLIRLLDHYGTAGTMQNGDFAGSGNYHNFQRTPFSRVGLVGDGQVDIWDLVVLLDAYNLDETEINTPVSPENLQVVLNPAEHTHTLSWESPADDINDGYKVYGSNVNTSGQEHLTRFFWRR